MTTTPALSADTPESVAAKLREAARAQSAGFPHERPEWQAADFVKAQAAEIARLSSIVLALKHQDADTLMALNDWQDRATRAEADASQAGAALVQAVNERDRAEAALAASEERVRAMREALTKARPLIDAIADESSWVELRPDGPGHPFHWFIDGSTPLATDTAADALAVIDAALSTVATPPQDTRALIGDALAATDFTAGGTAGDALARKLARESAAGDAIPTAQDGEGGERG